MHTCIQSFKKVIIRAKINFKIIIMGIKRAEFLDDFESVEKVF